MPSILVVDDRAINREVLSLLLDEQGYQILEAEDGIQALEMVHNTPVDLIITDIAMPKMDGLTLVNTLHSDPHFTNIPVIFYSATYKAAEAFRLADASNVKFVLTKPCDPEIILSTVEDALMPTQKQDIIHYKFKKINQPRYPMRTDNKNEKLENINLRLTNLIEIGLDMSLEHDIEKLTYIMCKGGRQFLDACYTGIILQNLNNLNECKNFKIGRDNKVTTNLLQLSNITGLLKEVFPGGKTVCAHSPLIDFERIGLSDITLPISSLLSIPLKTSRKAYGLIYFIYKFNQKLFSVSDQRFMMTLADKFVINYENLMLYQEYIQSQEKLHLYREQMAEVIRANSLGEMASSLAHEINQPLAAIAAYIRGCIKRLENKFEITPDIMETLRETALQAERAGQVVHRIKSFVRKGELFYEAIDINSLIESALQLMQQEIQRHTVKITFIRNSEVPLVEVDKIQLQQVILNLLRNSIEAMQEAHTTSPHITLSISREKADRIMVSVVDNGPGFSKEIKKQLFDLYFTTKAHGMGLGLAICRSIIEAHAGQLTASVLPEGGSCLQFDLPTVSVKEGFVKNFPLKDIKNTA